MKLTRKEYSHLAACVREAAVWRGQYTGHPDAADTLAEFDAHIAVAKSALKKINPTKRKEAKPEQQ